MKTSLSSLRAVLLYLAAVIVVGLPAIGISLSIFEMAIEAAGSGDRADSPAVVSALWAVSILLGLQLAAEVAAVQIGGFEALSRGSPRVALARTLSLTLASLVALAALSWGILSVFLSASGPLPYVLALLVGLGWLLVCYRVSTSFFRGAGIV